MVLLKYVIVISKSLLSQLCIQNNLHLYYASRSNQAPSDVIPPTEKLNTLHIHLCSSDTQTVWPTPRLHRDIAVVIESDERLDDFMNHSLSGI